MNKVNVGGNIIWATAEQLIRVGLTFFINIAIARHLGPESYGILGTVFAIAGILQCVSNCGIDNICIREVAGAEKSLGQIISNVITIRLIVGLIVLSPVCIWCLLNRGQTLTDALLYLVILIPFQLVGTTIGNIFSGKLLSKFSTFSLVSAMVVAGGLRIYGITTEKDLLYFIYCYLAEYTLATLLVIYCFLKVFGKHLKSCRPTRSGIRSMILGARWLLISALAVQFLQNAGFFFLAKEGAGHELGAYAAAARLFSVTQFLPAIIGQSFIPAVIKAYDEASPELAWYETQLFRCLASCGYLITIFSLTVGPGLLRLLLGSKFDGAVPAFMILASGSIPLCMAAARAAIFSKKRNYKAVLAGDIIGVILIVFLSFFLVRLHGSKGAALATTIGYFVAYLIAPYFLMKGDIDARRRLFKAFVWPFPNLGFLFKRNHKVENKQ